MASLEFGVPTGVARPAWELYVRAGLPLAGRVLRHGWSEVGDFLGGSIRAYWEEYPLERQLELWAAAGIRDVEVRRLSLGGGVVHVGPPRMSVPTARPSWYALETGGWRDYVTLLHLPYTRVAPVVRRDRRLPRAGRRVGSARRRGRRIRARRRDRGTRARRAHGSTAPHEHPELRSSIGLAAISIGAACAIGVAGAILFEAWLAALVPVGVFLVLAYNLELVGGRFHSDLWFGLAWGGFPVICGYAAVAGDLSAAALLGAAFAVLLSLAQRALSNHVRYVRRRVADGRRRARAPRRLTRAARSPTASSLPRSAGSGCSRPPRSCWRPLWWRSGL